MISRNRRERAFGKAPAFTTPQTVATTSGGEATQPARANGRGALRVSDVISDNLGEIRTGRLLVGTGELGVNYSGLMITDEGIYYDGYYWNLIGLLDEYMQVGISTEDGALYAGRGAVVLDERGVNIYDTANNVIAIMGDMAGYFGTFVETWGLGVGSDDNYMAYDVTNGFRIVVGDNAVKINEDGISLYDGVTLVGRWGDLDGTFGIIGASPGFATGDYASGNYMRYEPTGGLHIAFGDGDARLSSLGLDMVGDDSVSGRLIWHTGDVDGLTMADIMADWDGVGTGWANFFLAAERTAGCGWAGAQVILEARDDVASTLAALYVKSNGTIILNSATATMAGNIAVARGGTDYTTAQLVLLASALTSTSWDGDAKTTADNGVIDLSAVFGAPAGIKGALIKMIGTSTTVGRYFGFGADASVMAVAQRVAVASQNIYNGPAVCPCDANGDIYFYTDGNMSAVHLQIWGYLW